MAWWTAPGWESATVRDVRCREHDRRAQADTAHPENLHLLVRTRLRLPTGACTLRISADDYFHAWLDGAFLGCGPSAGWPENYAFCEYSAEGGREITIALHVYYHGRISRAFSGGDGRFAFYVGLFCDGVELDMHNALWRCQVCDAWSGAPIGYDTQFLENFDSRRYPNGWESAEFDDSSWAVAPLAAWADYRLRDTADVPLQWTRREPARVTEDENGILLDFGQVLTGLFQCDMPGTDGQEVQISCHEGVGDSGFSYCEKWTLADGPCRLHWFDYKTFRYVRLSRKAQGCVAWVRHFPMDDSLCTLSCPTDALEQIFRISKNAVRCCAQEAYLDCPSREKGQYLGDAILTARSHLWLTGDNRLLRKCIRDFMDSGAISPALMAVAPGTWMQEIADFSLLFAHLPLLDYEFTGDLAFLRTCYPAVVRITEAFGAYEGPDGLLHDVSAQWNLVDWPENCRDGYDFPLTRPHVGKGCHNVINMLWYGAWKMRRKIECLLDIPGEDRCPRLEKALRSAFWNEAEGLFADAIGSRHCSLHANIYAAYYGIHPNPEGFVRLMQAPGRHCGVFVMYFGLRALCAMGRHDVMYRLLTREDAYGWRNMLREGATAAFEVWGIAQKWNTSLCHGWAGYPVSLIIEELAGLRPGRELLEFSPNLPKAIRSFSLRVPYRGKLYRTNGKELCYAAATDE